MVCKNCGTYIEEDARFCPECGKMLEAQPQPEYHYSNRNIQQKNGGGSNALIITLSIISAVLFLLITIILAFMWMDSDEKNEKPISTPTPAPTYTASPIVTPTPTPVATPTPISQHKIFKADVTWEQANQNALYDGGHLVYVNNAEEFGKVCALANSMRLKAFWLGASRAPGQSWSATRWGDGSYMNYTYWYENEPTMYDSNGNEERYLMAFNVNGIWYFNDSMNNVNSVYPGRIGYIVEYE